MRLELAKNLVAALEQIDTLAADQIVEELAGLQRTQLFLEIGRLTRLLHNSLLNVASDSKIPAFREQDIPDAKERLTYVISMTEQAANQTLSAVEHLLPISEQLNLQGNQLMAQWEKYLGGGLPDQEFKALSVELFKYLKSSNEGLVDMQNGLTDILIAQGYQDITGQIIRKVIDFVLELEQHMVSLVRETSSKRVLSEPEVKANLPGPVVPGVDDKLGNIANNQDDVDDLLSSLGF